MNFAHFFQHYTIKCDTIMVIIAIICLLLTAFAFLTNMWVLFSICGSGFLVAFFIMEWAFHKGYGRM